MNKAILTVAVGKRRDIYTEPEYAGKDYSGFLNRFVYDYTKHCGSGVDVIRYDALPEGCPPHDVKPYAFKAYALAEVIAMGYKTILWSDASTYPRRSMEPLWEKIERDGYWFSNNRFYLGQWCSDNTLQQFGLDRNVALTIPETLGAAYGVNLDHEGARLFASEYIRWVKETDAICGPWTNSDHGASADFRVMGHRHDQTIISFLTHSLNLQKTRQPRTNTMSCATSEWYCDDGHYTQWDKMILTNDYARSSTKFSQHASWGYCWPHKSLGCLVCAKADYENQVAGRSWQSQTPERRGAYTVVST